MADDPVDEDLGRGVELADEAFCWSLSRFVFIGARAMLALQRRDGLAVDQDEWRAIVLREAPELDEARMPAPSPQLPLFEEAALRQDGRERSGAAGAYLLTWLWDALSRRALLSFAAVPERPAPVAVLPAGSVFRFELGGSVLDDVRAVIEGPLQMRPGKRGRLECQPVATRVEIEGEAGVVVGSLNEAYTLVSQRREPHRRSHTGNVYRRVLWVGDVDTSDGEHLIRLEEILKAVARGAWRGLGTTGAR